jgi:hypothetical protein
VTPLRLPLAAAVALLAGCGSLPTTSEGVAILEIRPPDSLTVFVGDSLRFGARALDKSGKPLAIPIHWRTPDSTVSVGDTSGVVIGLFVGPGRVQAFVDDSLLVSDFITVTVQARPAAGAAPP